MQPGTASDFELCLSTFCNIEQEKEREHPLSEDAYYLDGCLWGIRYALCTVLNMEKLEFKERLDRFKEEFM